TVPVAAAANDDVAVVAVDFQINGATVFTDTSSPYQFGTTAPVGASVLTIGATATDLGGNTGVADNVMVTVTADPLTTVEGRVVDHNGAPVPGATVGAAGHSATTGADGTFSIPGLTTIQKTILVTVSVIVNGASLVGQST